MRKKISFILKIAVVVLSLIGIVLNFICAEADGYSHWSKRLLYFTNQSNIWIAAVAVALLLLSFVKQWRDKTRAKEILYVLKYIFTISITLTGFIFCAVLAPGAKNADYNAWTAASIIAHVIVPVLSILDFFIDGYRVNLKRRHIFLCLLPPFLYLAFASILGIAGVDFGRGDTFPYFFLNYNSPAGVFGTSDVMPYKIGSFYWIVFMLGIILGISALYFRLYTPKKKDSENE